MKRRSFLHLNGPPTHRPATRPSSAIFFPEPRARDQRGEIDGITNRISSAGLEPYQPSAERPWNMRRAGHLLRRTGFGCSWDELTAALASTPGSLVEVMLADAPAPAPPGDWVSRTPFPVLDNNALAQYYVWYRELQQWWTSMMLGSGGLREKMALFWHNHFVSEYPDVYVMQYFYIQNQLFRADAFGDFRELVRKVTVDPAMLIYLNGNENKAGNPNENYARELLELFTIGAGFYGDETPHYTEHDVIELARALTGWTVNPTSMTGEFRPARYDNGAKTILGRTASFGVAGMGGEDVIPHIFSVQDKDRGIPRAAVFICTKLYQYFVHEVPDVPVVSAMAEFLVQTNWRIRSVLGRLLTSAHFFDDNVIGARIKSPAELVAGAFRELKLTPVFTGDAFDINRPETHDPSVAMSNLAQTLFDPPNVKGWPGGRAWISSSTVPLRIRYARLWIEPVNGSLPFGFDPVGLVKSLPDNKDVDKLLDHLIELLLPIGVGTRTREILLDELLAGAPKYEWNPDAPNAAARIRACMVRITGLAEYQLM